MSIGEYTNPLLAYIMGDSRFMWPVGVGGDGERDRFKAYCVTIKTPGV